MSIHLADLAKRSFQYWLLTGSSARFKHRQTTQPCFPQALQHRLYSTRFIPLTPSISNQLYIGNGGMFKNHSSFISTGKPVAIAIGGLSKILLETSQQLLLSSP
jgi:hypothetical protein